MPGDDLKPHTEERASSSQVDGLNSLDIAIQMERNLIKELGLSTEEARSWIDNKERALLRTMFALRALRNTLSPIQLLPDELLIHIFCLVAHKPHQNGTPSQKLSWVSALTTVCRQWRTLALGAPHLWASFDTHKPVVARQMLRLSQGAPLDVVLNGSGSSLDFHNLIRAVEPFTNRLRSLECVLKQTNLDESTLKFGPAEILETLCLQQISSRRVILDPRHSIIMPDIFEGNTPCLRRIILNRVSIPWTPKIYSGLTHLELLHQHPDSAPSLHQFLGILESCPGLRTLILIHAGPKCRSPSPKNAEADLQLGSSSVSLSELKELTVSNSSPNIHLLLSQLELPLTADICIMCEREDANADLSNALPSESHRLRILENLNALQVSIEEPHYVAVAGRRLETYTAGVGEEDYPFLISTTLKKEFTPSLANSFISQLPLFFPLTKLTQIHLNGCNAYFSRETWSNAFKFLERLEVLIIEEFAASKVLKRTRLEFLDALSGMGFSGREVVCPLLRRIELIGLTIYHDEDSEVTTHLGDFVECFRLRKARGAPLEELLVSEAGEGIVCALESVVGLVLLQCFEFVGF